VVDGKLVYGEGMFASPAPVLLKVAPDWLPIGIYPGYSKSASIETGERLMATALAAATPTVLGAGGVPFNFEFADQDDA
jgi:hypothetical protein